MAVDATGFWRCDIIDADEVLNPGSFPGVSMDSSTAAIENEAAFAFEDSAERPLFEAALTRPTADPVLDQNSTDLEL